MTTLQRTSMPYSLVTKCWLPSVALTCSRGALPPSRLRRVLAWARDHQDAMALNWIKCQEEQAPERI
jgi:hypothetical protein